MEMPRNDAAVASTVARELADDNANLRYHFTWTPAMIYRRYGMPDTTNTSGAQTVTWQYFGPPGGHGIKFIFVRGVVQA